MTSSIRSVGGYALVNPPHQTSVRNAFGYALVRRASDPLPIREVPSDLRKAQRQLLYDLIEETNPGFQALFPLAQLDFGTPSASAVVLGDPYKRDTQVVVSAKAGSGFMGSKTIRYRRIDLSFVFRNMTAQLTDWYSAAATALPKAAWIAALNAKYGLLLLESDIPVSNIGALPWNTVYGMTIDATCLCYKATAGVNLQWLKGKRPMLDMIPDAKQVLVGRAFPAGNDFTDPNRKPVGEWETFGLDASELKTTLEALAASQVIAVGSTIPAVNAVLNFLAGNSGRDYFSNKASTVKGGLGGLTWYKYTIPNAGVPEANSQRFNRVIVIQGIAGSWFSGKILLHYNV